MQYLPYDGPERRWLPRYLTIDKVRLPYVSRAKAFETVDHSLRLGHKMNLAFCNANTLLMALRDPDYAESLSKFVTLNDGVGIDLCSWLLSGQRFEDNLNGTDFIPHILNNSSVPLDIFLLGSKPAVIEEAGRRLGLKYPRHRIVGTHHGFFKDAESREVVDKINAARPNLALIGMGNPRQERFIAAHRDQLDAPVVAAVGAFVDFSAGAVTRAPALIRRVRMEWAYRLWLEPRRLGRRYTVDMVEFLAVVARMRIAGGRGWAVRPGLRLRPDL